MISGVGAWIGRVTGKSHWKETEVLQRLWSGYGSILRYNLEGTDKRSVIVKHVSPPASKEHPRGWNTDLSHQRKLRSYKVETTWYQRYAALCGVDCRVPQCLAVEALENEVFLLLEDLDAAGFSGRRNRVNKTELQACITWLAHFHARFLGLSAEGLWDFGTYWHLETRPDELERLSSEDPPLWRAAAAIDAKLKQSPFQTIVHGDAKLANFCFAPDGASVSVVDFQYVGRGCGMKDLAYFIGSCLGEKDLEHQTPALLDFYFKALRSSLQKLEAPVAFDALEADWRVLFPFAWTDFHRFLKGWSPGHWKIHDYSERLARTVLEQLKEESK